jgi:hypothetical protein
MLSRVRLFSWILTCISPPPAAGCPIVLLPEYTRQMLQECDKYRFLPNQTVYGAHRFARPKFHPPPYQSSVNFATLETKSPIRGGVPGHGSLAPVFDHRFGRSDSHQHTNRSYGPCHFSLIAGLSVTSLSA